MGDTHHRTPAIPPPCCRDSKKFNPMVFSGLYSDQHGGLRASQGQPGQTAIETTRPLFIRRKVPFALGFGFRCGFLGLLHLEIVQERLRREYTCISPRIQAWFIAS